MLQKASAMNSLGATALVAGPGDMLVGCGKSVSYMMLSGPRTSIAALAEARSNQKQPYTCRLKYSLGSRSYSGCSWRTPLFSHCQSSASSTNGTQPMPLSTETKFSVGWRWQMPEMITSITARELSRNSDVVI